jgi:hypothetical protein
MLTLNQNEIIARARQWQMRISKSLAQ